MERASAKPWRGRPKGSKRRKAENDYDNLNRTQQLGFAALPHTQKPQRRLNEHDAAEQEQRAVLLAVSTAIKRQAEGEAVDAAKHVARSDGRRSVHSPSSRGLRPQEQAVKDNRRSRSGEEKHLQRGNGQI